MMRYLLLMLCLLVPSLTRAETIDARLAKSDPCGRFEVIHINGIMTDPDGAQANLDRLIKEYGNAHNGHLIAYGLAYNQTRGLPSDLLDSFTQVALDFPGATFADWILNVVFGTTKSTMTTTIAKTIGQRWAGLLGFTAPRPAQYQDQDLADIILSIRQRHVRYAKLLLVPHSQGNLYANLVYDRLAAPPLVADFPPQSLLMAHIANPATTLRTGPYHVTSDKDMMMKAVRWAVPATPAPNALGMPYSLSDPLGHKWNQIYMTIEPARTNVITLISQRLSQLKTTAPDPTQWMRSVGQMYYCGTLPPWYGPGPWLCYINGQYFTTNTIQAPIAGSYGADIRAGSLATAETAARAHATGCYQMFVNDRIAQIQAGTYILRMIPGCGYSYPATNNYAYNANVAWMIYSADSSAVRANYEFYPPIPYMQAGNDVVNVETFPTCRRS